MDGIVPTSDNPLSPSLSFRAVLLGTFWCIFLGVANTVLAFRTTHFELPPFLATLLAYPMGIFLAQILPRRRVKLGWLDFDLNPGPFGIKEHVLITVIASAGAKPAYGLDNVITQRSSLFMGNVHITYFESLLWVLSTQFLGFGMAG